LTGLIMFVDTEQGSNKILRLILAIIVSTFYLTVLLHVRPYHRNEDHNLALVSSFLLICCFVLGITIQQCNGDDEICESLIGYSLDHYRASVLAITLVLSMLFLSVLFILIAGLNHTPDPTIKLISTNHEPSMDLPEDCKHHAFVSHIWSTGQDKTHALVRKLQLHLPGIKIWLDVDNLSNIEDLETSVKESAVFILMYTDGYFKSRNCQREISEAARLGKPVIIVYDDWEGDINNSIEKTCLEHFKGSEPSAEYVLRHILTDEPVLWLGASS